MQKKREVGIDIIKILACMFVSGLHFFVNYGFTDKQLSHPIAILQIALRWIFFTCIALFILATGYLQCSKKPEKKYYQTLGKHLAYFFVYACLTAVVINGTENLVRDSLYYFLQYPSYFWYMSFFIGFYLLIPFFNILIEHLQKEEFLRLILILLAVTSIPEFVNWLPPLGGGERWKYFFLPNWWREFFPLTYYFIGAYFRKYRPVFPKKTAMSALLGFPLLIACADYYYTSPKTTSFIGGGYGSVLTVLIAVAIFALCYNISIQNRMICMAWSYLSTLTLNVYLGLIISDKYTRMAVSAYERNGIYPFRVIILEAPLNFGIALGIAVAVDLIRRLCVAANLVSACIGSVSGGFYTRFDLAVGTGGGNCGNERAPSAVS